VDAMADTDDDVWSPKSKATNIMHFSTYWSVSRPKID